MPASPSKPATADSARLTRTERQALTRQRFLAAGRDSYLERGFHGASAAEIARRAGFSTGALYSNFSSKDDLLLSVLDEHFVGDVERLNAAVTAASSPAEVVDRVGDWFATLLGDDPRWRVLEVEISIAAVGKADLAERLRTRQRTYAAGLARLLAEQAARLGVTLSMAPQAMSAALLGLGDGLGVHALLDPGSDVVAVFRAILAVLLGVDPGGDPGTVQITS